jgi:ribosomal protein L15E
VTGIDLAAKNAKIAKGAGQSDRDSLRSLRSLWLKNRMAKKYFSLLFIDRNAVSLG